MKMKMHEPKAELKAGHDSEPEQPTEPVVKWSIDADIQSGLKRDGLELLENGVTTRKVANFCGINIKSIKRI